MTRYVNLALRKLGLSTHPKHRLVAVIVRGGSVVAFASNRGAWGAHAEKRALRAAGDVDGCTLIVVRDGLAMARPCRACQKAIRLAGIRKVYYTNNGILEVL